MVKKDKGVIFLGLSSILSEQLHVESSQINENSNIKNDLGADSLDIAEIVLMIKEKYKQDISDEDLKNIQTVGDLLNVLTLVAE